MESSTQFDSLVTDKEIFEAVAECRDIPADTPPPPPEAPVEGGEEIPSYKPYVGMEFESVHQAFLFYNDYAAIVGFSIRKDKTRKSNVDGACLFRRFCCSKEGYPRNSKERAMKLKRDAAAVKVELRIPPVPRLSRRAKIEKKRREEVLQRMRVGCNAKLDVKRTSDGKWVVQKFVEEHNHECVSLGDAHLLRSHRGRLIADQQNNGQEVGEIASPEELRTRDELNSLKPSVGMEFESHHKAFLFYNAYARVLGFVVRKDKTRRSNIDGSLLFRRFCCSKEGYRRKNSENDNNDRRQVRGGILVKVRPRILPVTRVGCNAKLEVKKTSEGRWVVQNFIEEHNHEFDRLGEFNVSRSKLAQSTQGQAVDSDGGTREKKLMDVTREAGGSGKLFHSGPLYRNRLYKKKKKKLEKGDAHVLFNYFGDMQTENPSFFYAVEVDEDDQMLSCFWADSRSRTDFSYFGDVVFLETSYGINQYGRPFAPLVGVNHHLQTIVFGCAIMLSETVESFTWLLETLLKAMRGRRPIAIVTDQDEEMATAIERVLPGTHHCLSLSHIFQNTAKNLNHLYTSEVGFSSDFKRCIYESQSSDEFESRWESLLAQYELRDNDWFHNLYSKRHKWVPIYSRHIFQADMMTTQRTESIHSFFNDCLNKSLRFNEFVSRYEKAIIDSRQKEAHEDFTSHQTRHILTSELPMEKQAADDYTRSMFREFQKEFSDSFNYIAVETETVETDRSFVVSKWGEIRNFSIHFNSHDNNIRVSCSCQYFELMGILCRHILKVFTATNTILIPEVYLKKRWTKKAKFGVVLDDSNKVKQADNQNSLALRYRYLCQLALNLSAKGAISLKAYQIAKSNIRTKLSEIEKDGEEQKDIIRIDVEGNRMSCPSFKINENNASSKGLVGEDSQMLSAVSQAAFYDSSPARTRGRLPKRTTPSSKESQRNKKARTGPVSSENMITSHSRRGIPVLAAEPSDPCNVQAVAVQGTQNHRLLNMYPNICMYAPGPSGDLNDQYHPSDTPNFGEPFAGLSCIQTSEPNIFDLNQDVTVGHSSLPNSYTSHLDLNQVNHVARPSDSRVLPSSGWIKLNFGGCSKEISFGGTRRRVAGFGGTISVSDGSIIKAYAGPAGEVQAVEAEILALCNGLKILSSLPTGPVWIEGDSELVIKWLRKENDIPWRFITPMFFEIETIISSLALGRVTHIHKEGNSMVDKLANEGLTKDSITIWDQLPLL